VTSIRAVAENCLDLSGSFSVRRDVYGYIWGTMNRDLSLKNHMELIQGPSCNLCLFLVGHEPDFSGEFTPADTQRMQAAIDVARGIYAQENFGIRKLYWRYIPSSEAGGYTVVDGSEATDLTEDYSGLTMAWTYFLSLISLMPGVGVRSMVPVTKTPKDVLVLLWN